jgi:hypothetical protein
MSFPVKLELYKDGHLFSELIAENEDDLYCSIEMDTGIGWLDAEPLYQLLLEKGCAQVSDTFRVCNSFEKWGAMQQEVVSIKVCLRRIEVDRDH